MVQFPWGVPWCNNFAEPLDVNKIVHYYLVMELIYEHKIAFSNF